MPSWDGTQALASLQPDKHTAPADAGSRQHDSKVRRDAVGRCMSLSILYSGISSCSADVRRAGDRQREGRRQGRGPRGILPGDRAAGGPHGLLARQRAPGVAAGSCLVWLLASLLSSKAATSAPSKFKGGSKFCLQSMWVVGACGSRGQQSAAQRTEA